MNDGYALPVYSEMPECWYIDLDDPDWQHHPKRQYTNGRFFVVTAKEYADHRKTIFKTRYDE